MWFKNTLHLLSLAAIPFLTGGCLSQRIVEGGSSADFTQTLRPGDTVLVRYALFDSTAQGGPQAVSLRAGFEDYSLEEEWIGVRSEGERYSVPFRRISSLAVLRDRRKPNGPMIGRAWLWGGVIAGVAGIASLPMSDSCSGFFCISDQEAMIGLGIMAGVTTGVVGTVGGLLGTEETWEEVALPGAGPQLLLSPSGRLGIGLEYRF